MKDTFVVEQKPFISILSSMQPICSKRTTVATTNYILFQLGHKELVLKCTDLEISLQCSYTPKELHVGEPRSILVFGKRIFDLVKELEGDITCTITNNQLLLKSGSVNLALNISDAQEFPPFPERIENLMQIDSPFLLEMLNKVAFLIPQNNSNPALNGLFLEISKQELKMTTTDGHCLAQITTPKYTLEEDKKWLVPRRAIFEVKKFLETSKNETTFLGVCGNQMVFSGESFNFFTKLLVDQFPQYDSILTRDGFLAARVDKNHLVKTLRRSSCLLSGQFIATRFLFNQNVVNVSMQNNDVGTLEEEVPLTEFKGDEVDIRFYAPYLLNGLQAFSQDSLLTFYLKTASKPVIFESYKEDTHLLYLVMPVSPTTPQTET